MDRVTGVGQTLVLFVKQTGPECEGKVLLVLILERLSHLFVSDSIWPRSIVIVAAPFFNCLSRQPSHSHLIRRRLGSVSSPITNELVTWLFFFRFGKIQNISLARNLMDLWTDDSQIEIDDTDVI